MKNWRIIIKKNKNIINQICTLSIVSIDHKLIVIKKQFIIER